MVELRVARWTGAELMRTAEVQELAAVRGTDLMEFFGNDAARAGVSIERTGRALCGLADVVSEEMRDGPRDECGVFGVYAPGYDVSRLAFFALYALQHRGQESAGIAAADRGGYIVTRRDLGLVSHVFNETDIASLGGELAIGHVRYSTTGSNAWENSQPVQRGRRSRQPPRSPWPTTAT